MVQKFENFEKLLEDLKQRKLKTRSYYKRKSHRYFIDRKCFEAELKGLCKSENFLSLIDSFDKLYSVFKEFPDHAYSVLINKKELIKSLGNLIKLKEIFRYLPPSIMIQIAKVLDIEDETDIQINSYRYPFLVEPLMRREENRKKIKSLAALLRITECDPTLVPLLFQDERLRRLIELPDQLEKCIELNSDIAVAAFRYEYFRKMFKTPNDLLKILCLMIDEDIPHVLRECCGDQGVSADIFIQFERAQSMMNTPRSIEVIGIIQNYVVPHDLEKQLSFSLLSSVDSQAELMNKLSLLSTKGNDEPSNDQSNNQILGFGIRVTS